ncbi:MAG: hypothetical protein NTV80_23115 [Verrucomicrobia bacterium]|nr:hypothetical protein [Verrucomicrobiota bacterium]
MNTLRMDNGPIMAKQKDAGNRSYGICRVIDVSRSHSPEPKRQPNNHHPA